MKYLKMLVIAVGLFCLAACSGSASYNPEKCEQLKEKIRSDQKMTETDYNDMIDQIFAICDQVAKEQEAAGEDKEKYKKEFADTEEAKDMVGYLMGFAFYLESHEKDLSQANIRKLNKAMEEFKKLND